MPVPSTTGAAYRPAPVICGFALRTLAYHCPRPTPPPCSAASHVVREALKWKAKDAEAVDIIHTTAPELIAVYKQLQGQPDGVPGACLGAWTALLSEDRRRGMRD